MKTPLIHDAVWKGLWKQYWIITANSTGFDILIALWLRR